MASFNSFYQNKNKVISPELKEYQYDTSLITSGNSVDFDIGISRNFDLSKIEVNNICRLRLYISLQARQEDRNRTTSTPPSDLSGCLIDSVFSSSDLVFSLSPALSFVNSDNPQNSTIYGILENTDSTDHNYQIKLFVSYPLTERVDWFVVRSDVGSKQLVNGEKIIAQSGLSFTLPSSGEIYIYADGDGITVGETILKPDTLYLLLYDPSQLDWKIINFNKEGGGGGSGLIEAIEVNFSGSISKNSLNISSTFLTEYNNSDSTEQVNVQLNNSQITDGQTLKNYTKVDSII